MHWISSYGSKLADNKPNSLLIYFVLFCNLSDFHCISTLNIQYMHSVFEFDQCVCVTVCGDLSLCACKVTLNYLHIANVALSQHSDRKFGE